MKSLQSWKSVTRAAAAALTLSLMFVASAALFGQEKEKEKKKDEAPPQRHEREAQPQRQRPPEQQQHQQQQARPASPQVQQPTNRPPDQAQPPANREYRRQTPSTDAQPNRANPNTNPQPTPQGTATPGNNRPSYQGRPSDGNRPNTDTSRPVTDGNRPTTERDRNRPGSDVRPGTDARPSFDGSRPNNTGARPSTDGRPTFDGNRPNTTGGRPSTDGRPSYDGNRPSNTQNGTPNVRTNVPNAQGSRFSNRGPEAVRTSNGGMVRRDFSGRVSEVRTPSGAVVTQRVDGIRRVQAVRPGNRVVVTTSAGRYGYVQRSVAFRNTSLVQRTYYGRGGIYARAYRPYSYRGFVFDVYAPSRYYRPAFYSWAYNPWPRPIVYSWGWSSPWYGYYGGYFTPYPSYASPLYWLTDYMIATTLQDAYQERMDAGGGPSPYYPPNGYGRIDNGLTPDVKQAVSDEVRRQLDQERMEAQNGFSGGPDPNGPPPMFSDGPHVFVVSSPLEVATIQGQGCVVTEGDVLQLTGTPSADASYADTVVLASKGQDCRKGAVVSVQFQDLQEMQNQMRATLDQGLQQMQGRQGQAAQLPPPPSNIVGTQDAPWASDIQPDSNVGQELAGVAQDANQGYQDTLSQAPNPGDTGGPPTISLGQTVNQVVAALGRPQKVVELGARRIYVYPDLKITFTDGKVSDVQ
jgi:hypothetical protein